MSKQKTFPYFFVFMLVFFGLAIFGLVAAPKALAIAPGDLIKESNSTAVYYVASGNTKYVFPSEQVFLSWYPDFSLVQTVVIGTLQQYQTVGNVVLRAGTKLIQFVAINPDGTMNVDDPKVYAVEPNGVRRWITTAAIAQQLYGQNWETKIYGSPNTLISNYSTGASITSATYPEGTIVKESGSAEIYYINANGEKQHLVGDGFSGNLFQEDFILTTTSLASYPTGSEITGNLPELTQVAGGTAANQAENVYYVATNGNDNNAGTLTSPFRTISKAAQVATAGDIVYIRGGTYEETVTPPNSGTENNYITFTNYPNETVIVKAVGGDNGGYGFHLVNGIDYIRINGLNISRGLGAGVETIYNNYKNNSIAHGAAIKLDASHYNLITDNNIYDNDIGILVSEGYITGTNNTIAAMNNEIINNIIHNNGEAGIRIKRADYTTIDSNTIYGHGLTTNNVYAEPSPGIAFYCSIGTKITNNTIYGNATHALHNYAGTDQVSCDTEESLIKNNILSQTLTHPIPNLIYTGKKIVLTIAQKEATDSSHIYRQNTFYNSSYGSDIVAWGVDNTATIGETITLTEFNNNANVLNSNSGVGNIEVSTNPIQ